MSLEWHAVGSICQLEHEALQTYLLKLKSDLGIPSQQSRSQNLFHFRDMIVKDVRDLKNYGFLELGHEESKELRFDDVNLVQGPSHIRK